MSTTLPMPESPPATMLPHDRPATSAKTGCNISQSERWLSALAGGGLVVLGLGRRSLGGLALAGLGAALVQRGVSGNCQLYRALGIDRSDREGRPIGVRAGRGFKYETSLFIARSPEDLYAKWRDLENLPQIASHLKSVSRLDDQRWRWAAHGPLGQVVEWDAEIINDRPGELIAWRSLSGSTMDTAGSVRFEKAPQGLGTIVRLSLKYDPPGGKAGASAARILGAGLEKRVDDDLRRFKTMMEAGEIPSVAGQPRGTCRG